MRSADSAQATAEYDRALDDWDLLLMPTIPMKATVLPAPDAGDAAHWEVALNMNRNTSPFCGTGHPSLNVPCGMSDGLPVGLMLTGKYWDEATIYRAAFAFEQSGDWKSHVDRVSFVPRRAGNHGFGGAASGRDHFRRADCLQLEPRGVRRHASRRIDGRELHLLRVGELHRHDEEHRPVERLVPRARRRHPQGSHDGGHSSCEVRGQDRHRARIPERLGVRGSARLHSAFQGRGRRCGTARLQHAEPRRYRVLRVGGPGPQRFRPGGRGRDESGRHALRPEPRGLPGPRRTRYLRPRSPLPIRTACRRGSSGIPGTSPTRSCGSSPITTDSSG